MAVYALIAAGISIEQTGVCGVLTRMLGRGLGLSRKATCHSSLFTAFPMYFESIWTDGGPAGGRMCFFVEPRK